MPEYAVYIREASATDQDWKFVGSMAVPRNAKIESAIYDNEVNLVKGMCVGVGVGVGVVCMCMWVALRCVCMCGWMGAYVGRASVCTYVWVDGCVCVYR